MRLRVVGIVVMLAVQTIVAVPARGQTPAPSALPPLLPRDREIVLARSAAPPDVSAPARVLVLERGGFVEAESGTSGVTCLVNRSHHASLEPHCYDAEGSRTVLPYHLKEAELREQGLGKDEIARRLAEELGAGRLRPPARPAMTYMMSPHQVLYDGERRVGAWRPHLMIYVPFITAADLGLGDTPSLSAAAVSDPGTPWANIMIVLPAFADSAVAPSGG
jgi:hypothetical protein